MPAPQVPYKPYADRFAADGSSKNCPTALEVVKDADVIGKLSDKVMIITGCTAGIGIETARALHTTGAKLYLAIRDVKKGEEVIKDITSGGDSKAPIELLQLDLSSLESVRSAAKDFLSREQKLNVLIHNAGIMACPLSQTVDGFERQIGTNHFGHFLFFQLLKPTLLASSTASFHSRVINVSSAAHHMSGIRFDDLNFSKAENYTPFVGYGQSKTANIYMANSIERHYGARGLHAFSVHPGVIATTDLGRHMDADQFGAIKKSMADISRSAPQGAATSVWAAVSPDLEGRGGVYLGDVGEASAAVNEQGRGGPDHAKHAYDEESEEKLWKLSYEAVGLVDEDN